MDHAEMNTINENKSNTIRKKSLFLRDGSYRIFHMTNKSKENTDDNNRKNNINQINNKSERKSLPTTTNRNGLKQFLLRKSTCESSSIEVKTPRTSRYQANELSQSVICHDPISVNLFKENKPHVQQERMNDWSKPNGINKTIRRSILVTHREKRKPSCRKQVLINIHPEIQASVHRKRKRFIVACGTVFIAISVIITIIIYVIIMTIKHRTQINQSDYYNHPRG